jgi:fibronectin type 3 domain-containing protein
MNKVPFINGVARRLATRLLVVLAIALAWLPPATTLLAASTIAYVQGNSAVPQSSQTTVTVTYSSAQAAGDLNVVVVGWNNSTATVSAVTDTSNNTYALAAGPTVITGVAAQSIYYAKNIVAAAAGANKVTVKFATAAAYPDIRILEYSGADTANPVDITSASTGNNSTSASASVSTTNATDLIFGANMVQTSTSGAGTGFTRRLLTSPDGDIAEDRMVTSAGSYNATAPLTGAGPWIMQMVAFRTPPAAPPPTAPSNLTATAGTASNTPVNLAWTASNSSLGIANYLVERCAGAACTNFAQIATPTSTSYSDASAAVGSYSYRVRATDTSGGLSAYSNTATAVLPDTVAPTAPANLTATPAGSQMNLSWTAATDNVGVTGYLVESCAGSGCTDFAQIGSTGATTTTFSNTGLTTGSFSYRVRATDAASNFGSYSNVATKSISDTQAPTAPSGLTATANGSQINLSWTASTDNVGVTSYLVERCLGAGCTNFAQIGTPAATTYSDNGVAPGTYSYRVRATDAAGNLSGYSNVASQSVADTTPPSAPAGLTASASGTTINLSWTASTDNVGVTNYLIERCEGAACSNFAQIATTTATLYADKSLAIDTFSYRVRATDAANNLSPYSSVASATTTSAPTAYLAGYSFSEGTGTTTADASGNNLTGTLQNATWTMGKYGEGLSFNGTTSYVDLARPAPLTTTGSMTWEAWVYPSGTPGDDGQILAFSDGGTGWQFKTTPDTGPRTFGVAVYGTAASAQRYGKTALALNTWYHVAGVYNAAAQTLDLYVNGVLDNAGLSGTVPSTITLPTSSVNVNIGRRSGGFYFIGTIDDVRIYGRTLSAAEIQNDMNTPVGQSADTTPPSAPTGLGATPVGGSEIDLSWTASTDNVGVANYLVERCQGAGCTNFAQIAAPKKTTFSDTGLGSNTSYSYRVRANDAAGNLSGYSNIASASTLAPQPPTAPGSLTAVAVTVAQVNLNWSASTADLGIAHYSVERCQGASCTSFAPIASPAGTTYSDTGLQANTSYSYRVRAIDTAGTWGPYSTTATAVTPVPQPPTAPTNLTATAVSASQVNLAWTASTSTVGIANYIVQRCQGAGCSSFATLASPTGTTYSDLTVTSGNTYSYQVQAVDTSSASGPFSNIASATPLNGLIAGFGLNEGMGTTTTDVSPNAITGTLQGATWTTSGKYGNALAFDGATSYVDIGRPVALNTTGSMTWEAWVYPTTVPGDDGQIVALADGNAGWQFKTSADTGPRTFSVGVSGASGSITQRYSNSVLLLNTWYHVAGVYNSTARTLDIYVNGVLDDGALSGTIPAQITLPAASVNASIGRRVGGFYFGGTIDEVRIYGRTLSQAEIQNDMNTPLPRPIASPNPSSLTFGNQNVNTTSAAQAITLTNTGNANLLVRGVSLVGSGAASFAQSNTCSAPVAPGANCTISVTFSPIAAGTLSSTLTIADNASNPHDVLISGTGVGGPIAVSPGTATITPILTQQFTSSVDGATWSVDGVAGGSAALGTISSTGLYTPPSTAGTHTITAATTSPPDTGAATVYVSTYAGTFTRDVSQQRIGLNQNETVLTPSNVNSTRFGKLYNYSIDGTSDASPLYVAGVTIPSNGVHNVVYVATEHDSVYAFDADGRQSTPLWQVSFINPANGVTTVPPNDTGECCDISPEIGITGTPTIDPTSNTLYVVAKTKEVVGGNTTYVHRLHALDLGTGAEKLGGPVNVSASVPGTGGGSSGGTLPFNSLHENQRSALLLLNGVVYLAFGSHGDVNPYHGWVLGYNASTLSQVMVFCTSPNTPGNGSGVWQSGDGLATDATGNLYFVTGEGLFNVNSGGKDYGDSLMRLSPTGTPLDYFTPHDQATLDSQNLDFGSGGVLLLPDQPGAHPHLAITAGKNATVYVVDRDNMGHYNSSNDNQVVQALPNMFPHGDMASGNFKAPVYWNGHVYFSADADFIKMFSITNGLLSTSPTSQSSWVANYPGATLGLSANGTTGGILWAIQRIGTDPFGNGTTAPGVLHAFDANNLGSELYNSSQSGTRDTLDYTAKWSAPLVANGRVFVATLSQLTVYGLMP